MTYLSGHQAVLPAEIWIVEVKSAACAAAETLNDQGKRIVVLAVGAGFGSDLMKVSGVRDELVEMQKNCPVVNDGAHEIYPAALLVHDPGRCQKVRRYRALGGVVGTSVFYRMSATTFILRSCTTYGGDLESRRGGPRSKSRPLPLRSPPRNLPPPRPRSGLSGRSL